MNINEIVNKIKEETNNNSDIIFRNKMIAKNNMVIVFNEPLTSSDKISDFIFRSLDKIENKKTNSKNLVNLIKNDIDNFKIIEVITYDEMIFYLNRGFTIIMIEKYPKYLVLETRLNLNRAINISTTENTIRGSKDSFVEDIQTNIGLIRKRIKTNHLWKKELYIGKYSQTKINILAISDLVSKKNINNIFNKIKRINVNGIIDGEVIKNLIENENKNALPTVLTTEKASKVCNSLLEGKVIILVDNTCYALIIPAVLNDFFKTAEDLYGKSINVTLTRIIKFLAFFIAVIGPAMYIAIITYNQEIIPTDLLVNFATQRDGVPFPAFIEAFIMLFAFEIIREADLRVPTTAGGALSIVGALILGDAAVNAGIVSPIMIIVIGTAAICSLPFNEADFINGLRFYRIIFMLGASMLGIIGIVIVFLFYLIKLCSLESFGTPYLMPIVPFDKVGIKDSFFKWKSTKKIIRYNQIEKSFNNEKD